MNNILEKMNPMQAEAVQYTEGPLLILAGAGSGKTRVLTHRIAYLIEEKQVAPWNIMAITFTNKAAQEMRQRVDGLLGSGAESVWVSTFHSACVRILRRYIDRIGYDNRFTIYDTDDAKTVIKRVMKKLNMDSKLYKERGVLAKISHAKNEMITAALFREQAGSEYSDKKIADAYAAYEEELKKNNALDFDDLLLKTVELFDACPEVLENYQNRLRYLMVDEYQDTNTVQFRFVNQLAARYRNLCVVGDDDQSIYKFRGANIRNILEFEKYFPDAKVVKLEQNYRSTQNILDAANGVIANNKGRKVKRLWTENAAGDKVSLRQFDTGYAEAEYVTDEIAGAVSRGSRRYSDFAVLYRTNAQSRMFEEKMLMAGIPYKIVGGVNFYARREIKDLLAYLKVIDNAQDDVAVQRIINVPRRGIGAATITRVSAYADMTGLNFFDAMLEAEHIPGIGRTISKITSFTNFILRLRVESQYGSVERLLEKIIEETGYVKELEAEGTDEAKTRIENIDELISKVATYEGENEETTLSGFLQEVALVADIDSVDPSSDYVLLMTLHSAKGLEFPCVYLTGMEDGVFPSYMTITSDKEEDLEEERRLCYVGITRAKEHLTMTSAKMRMVRGETQYNRVSRFVREVPRELLDYGRTPLAPEPKPKQRQSSPDGGFSFKLGDFKPKQFTVTKAEHLDYAVGDRVRHVKFGVGIVTEIKDGGKDYEVTVNFDKYGVKRMFASFAKLIAV